MGQDSTKFQNQASVRSPSGLYITEQTQPLTLPVLQPG